ncbi:MAG: ATP-binding protein, partial [Planctomycetota bacterium]|nr:ATP-binding protein [Planctomycetota bacterium]
MAKKYNADQLTVLQGLEAVRKRPGMYIGGVNSAGLHHCVWEILDNSIDEAMNGHASEITLTLHKSGDTVTISDNGRGIPVDKNKKTGKSGLELVLTELHAGGKFQNDGSGNYKTSGGLHGVGASVVNALSKRLVATVKRDGAEYRMDFAGGLPRTKLLRKKTGEVRGTGTAIEFTPDPKIFPRTTFNPETLETRLETASFLHSGVKMVFADQTTGKRTVFRHENGISDYLGHVRDERKAHPIHEEPFHLSKETPDARIELVFQWTESTDEHVRSYVNGITTGAGGSHENGLRAGLNKAIRNYL